MKNKINKVLLWVFLLPAGLYRTMGADIAQLRAILTAKLTMDDRRASGLYKMRGGASDGEASLATLFTMLISFITGLLLLFVLGLGDDLTRLTWYFSFFGLMLAMFMITDFSHILFDIKDNYIILPKPVASRTFLLSRLLHILIHLSKLLIPLSLPGIVVIGYTRGMWGALIFIIALGLLTALTFMIVNAIYLLIMRIVSPERLNSIIASIQIVFAVVVYGGFQLIPRIMDQDMMQIVLVKDTLFAWFFPSYWIACGWMFFYSLSMQANYIAGAILSIIIPVTSIWIVIKYLAPTFFSKLSMISSGHGESVSDHKKVKNLRAADKGLVTVLSSIFTSYGIEREAFLFAWRMTDRSREFKMKVYPQFGYFIVIIAFFFIGNGGNLQPEDGQIGMFRFKTVILGMVYLSCLVYVGALYQVRFSDSFRAAWIYFAAPMRSPGLIIRGTIKACLLMFFVPLMILIGGIAIILYGMPMIPNLLFGFGNILLVCMLYSWLMMDALPFSLSPKKAVEGQMSFRNIFMMIALPIFGIPQYFLFDFPWLLSILSVFTMGGAIGVLYYLKWISWDYVSGLP